MIIIFEGPDRTGKSHIAKKLAETSHVPYFKFDYESQLFNREDAFYNMATYGLPLLVEFIKQTKTQVILDRCYPSEIVYSRVFSRRTPTDIVEWADKEFKKMGAIMVLCYKDKVTELDDVVETKFYDELKSSYLALQRSKAVTLPIIELNTTDENLDKQIQYIVQEIRRINHENNPG